MNNLNALQAALAENELHCSVSTEDGIPYLTVWSDAVMLTIFEATRIAARVQAELGCPVHLHTLQMSSMTFFVFDPSRAYTAEQANDYGVALHAWIPTVLELPDVIALPQPPHVYEDADKPSIARGRGFLWSRDSLFASNSRSGKWCVMRRGEDIDSLWDQVRAAVRQGLVPAALVSTLGQAARHGGTHVLCVFTPDWVNTREVYAARELLRGLGVTETLGYKRDLDTERNVYGDFREWTYRA